MFQDAYLLQGLTVFARCFLGWEKENNAKPIESNSTQVVGVSNQTESIKKSILNSGMPMGEKPDGNFQGANLGDENQKRISKSGILAAIIQS